MVQERLCSPVGVVSTGPIPPRLPIRAHPIPSRRSDQPATYPFFVPNCYVGVPRAPDRMRDRYLEGLIAELGRKAGLIDKGDGNWSGPHEGPRGGTYWENTQTGERVYEDPTGGGSSSAESDSGGEGGGGANEITADDVDRMTIDALAENVGLQAQEYGRNPDKAAEAFYQQVERGADLAEAYAANTEGTTPESVREMLTEEESFDDINYGGGDDADGGDGYDEAQDVFESALPESAQREAMDLFEADYEGDRPAIDVAQEIVEEIRPAYESDKE